MRSSDWSSDVCSSDLRELAEIVEWVNHLNLKRPELLVVATALSAATRDAAWIRKSGWKLHRLSASDRLSRETSAWASFQRRLLHYVREVEFSAWSGDVDINFGRADAATAAELGCFDVVLTSPPYGASRTTDRKSVA